MASSTGLNKETVPLQSRVLQNTNDGDGKVLLSKEKLKKLRKSIGASQEKLAFMCAEQGLCVSIASIKRAETSKQVLYRTATELAKFYSVGIPDLLDDEFSPPESTGQQIIKGKNLGIQPIQVTTRHHAVFLALELTDPASRLSTDQTVVSLQPYSLLALRFLGAMKAHELCSLPIKAYSCCS